MFCGAARPSQHFFTWSVNWQYLKLSAQKSFQKQNVLCVGVVQCVCQRQRDRGKRRERGNYSGRNNVHLWPCVGKMLHCLCVCARASKYSRLVWLLSALTCIPFFSLSAGFFSDSILLLSPFLPHSAPASWSHLSSSSSHSVHSALQISPPTQMHTHTHTHAHTRACRHTHSQREVLLGSAGCVALPVLTLYLLLYLYPLSILYANLCMFTFCVLHPHRSPNARRAFMVPLAFILSHWYNIYRFFSIANNQSAHGSVTPNN